MLLDPRLQLGGHHPVLADLQAEVSNESLKPLDITLSSGWCDISLLTSLALTLQDFTAKRRRVTIDVSHLDQRRADFLWKIGFFQTVAAGLNGEQFVNFSPALPTMPKNIEARLNYTPIVTRLLTAQNRSAESVFESWHESFRTMDIGSAIEKTDLVQSGELFFILVWELLQNVIDHSKSRHVGVASQVFIPGEWETASDLTVEAKSSLASQYNREMTMSSIATRRAWIESNRTSPFVLISLVDTGIGISASVKSQNESKRLSDSAALRHAFDPDFSTRRKDPKFYDVHGLSQALRIIDEYGGYLFVQSGAARARKLPGEDIIARSISGDERLSGTVFQVLLPMHRVESSTLVSTSYRVTNLKGSKRYDYKRPLSLVNEMAAFGEETVQRDEKWPDFVEHLVGQHEKNGGGTVFLDLVCCPPSRQFLSFVLRALRKRFFFEGVVALNASAHVYALALSFLRARDEFKDLSIFERHAKERAELEVLCDDLSTALSRGRMNYSLSLLLPITRVAVTTGQIQITWLGLTGIEKAIASRMAWILSYLFSSGEALGIDDLVSLAIAAAPREESVDEAALNFVLRNTVVVNPFLLATASGKIRTTITIDAVRDSSFGSLHETVAKEIVPRARHKPPSKEKMFLYHLGWDYDTARYRKAYYELWRALATPEDLFVCVELLLRLVFDGLDERFAQLRAIVSVTPTAGLIGREIAVRLGIDFWEVPSVLELQGSPWIPAFPKDTAVLVACDLVDTGALTEKVVREIEDARSGKVLAVVSLARDSRSELPGRLKDVQIVAAVDVDLGRASKVEVERAEREGAFYEVDPHTLRPMPVAPHDDLRLANLRQRVAPLVAAGAVEIGHFIQGEHHYSSYFNLRAALRGDAPLWRSIYEWVSLQIVELTKRRKSTRIVIVYPYYSAIYLLVNLLRREGVNGVAATTSIRFAVAKPARRGGSVLAYSIEYSADNDARGADIIILDDAVVTGATTAALVDEALRSGARSILALAVVDRIGLRPRRHLRHIRTFRAHSPGEEALFDYRSFVDINMTTHDARNCRYCIVASDVTRNCSVNGLTEQSHASLDSLLKPHLRGSLTRGTAAGLTAEETLAYVVVADALHCEPPSSRQITYLLERHVPTDRVRLLLIRDLLQDVALDRQIAYKRNFEVLFKKAFSASGLTEASRATFLLHIPHFIRPQYAYDLLFKVMPSLYADLAADVAKGQPIPDPSLDGYFSRRQLEFSALSVALATLRGFHPSYKIDENHLGEWRKQFKLSKEAPAYSSIYYFELRQTFVQAQSRTIEKAKLLIYNFLGSYSGHPEAYHYRIHTFVGFAINGKYDKAKLELPSALFKNLLASIAHIQRELLPDNPTDAIFSDESLVALRDAYDRNCTPEGAEQMIDLFQKHFVSRQPRIQPATMSRLLRELAPNVYDIATDAIQSLNALLKRWDLADAEILTVIRDVKRADHVFCPKYLLQRTIPHLLRNPIENKLGLKLTDPSAKTKGAAIAGLKIELRLWINESEKTWLLIDVTDNSKTHMPPEDTLRQAGGLSAQSDLLKSVGNELLPSRLPDGRNLFRIRLQRVHINQIAFKPNED